MRILTLNFYKGVYNITKRELYRIVTNKDLFMICFLAPMVYGILLPYIYVNKQVDHVSMGLVDEDKSELSSTIVRYLDASQELDIVSEYPNNAQALSGIKYDKIKALLYIPKNFSSSLKKGTHSNLFIVVNSSNFLVANPILQTSTALALGVSAKIFAKKAMGFGVNSKKVESLMNPIMLETRPVTNPSLFYSNFMIPALFLIIIQQLILVGIAFSVADEKEHKREEKILTLAGGSRLAIVLGKTLPYVILDFSIGVFFVTVLARIFEVGVYNLTFNKILVILLFVSAVSAFGVFISSLFKTTLTAMIVLMFYSMPAFLVSGYAWPKFALPFDIKLLGYCFPSTYLMSDFRTLLLSDFPLRTYLPTIFSLLAFTLVAWTLAYLGVKYNFVPKISREKR